MHIGVIGYGKMGRAVQKVAEHQADEVHIFKKNDPLTPVDVFIDFSNASSVIDRLKAALDLRCPIVIGTTGWENKLSYAQTLVAQSHGTALYAPNFSLGVATLEHLISRCCAMLPEFDRAGIDVHHKEKKDAPSGTAKHLATEFHIPFSSVRLGTHMPKIAVMFDGAYETITLTHTAKSRESFAIGALQVAKWLLSQKGWKTLHDYLHSTDHPLQTRPNT